MDYKYQRRQIFGKRLKVPKLILNKVYNCTLSFNEYIEYQLDDKIPTSCIIESDRKIVEKFGIDKCKELDWELINKQVYYNKNINFRDVLMSIDSQTQDINSALYELVKDEIKPIDYTPKMREIYSDRLFDVSQNNDENLRYIINDFNEGIIGLKEIIYNWDLFKNKDLSYCLLNDNENKSNITDNILKEFMSSYGELASLIVENYDIYTFISDISSLKSEEEKKNFVKQFTDDILSNTKRKYGDIRLPIKPTDEQYKEIFKYSSMEEYFKTIDQYSAPLIIEELKSLPSDFIFNTSIPFTEILDYGVMHFIGVFGLKNVVDFNDECGEFFTKNNCEMLKLMYHMYLHYAGNEEDRQKNIYCDKDGNYIKGKFTKEQFYESMKRMIIYGPSDWNYADKAPDYRNITGEFRVRNSELFISEQAPEELQKLFYTKSITPQLLLEHPEYIQYLNGKDLSSCLKNRVIKVEGSNALYDYENFYKFLSSKTDFNGIMNFITEYSDVLDIIFDRKISDSYQYETQLKIDDDINIIKDKIHESFRRLIIEKRFPYPTHIPKELVEKYPDIFLDENVPEELQNLFYQRKISPEIIQSHPEWKQLLQGKHIGSVCDMGVSAFVRQCVQLGFDNDKVFELFDRYGSYLASCQIDLNNINSNNIGELDNVIRQQMAEAIVVKRVRYDESVRAILGQEHPELFLDENAPDELKEVFYNYTSNTPLTFEFLRQHKDWLPYLEGKNILLSLKKGNIGIRGLEQLFEKYGEQEALRIGMKNPKSVMQMLSENKFDVLSDWYDKLHFVPHHVVMEEFPFEQADKFVASGKKWSQLMRIERYNINEDSKAALLKASMCFGVFDNDIDGFNKTMQLFSDVPKTLSSQDMQRMIDFIQKQISLLGDNPDPKMVEDYNKQLELIQQCYGQSEEETFSLKINSQQNKNEVHMLRSIMEEASVSTILTPDKAHKLFGGFEMKYEPDFRDFILKNMGTILSSDEYIAYISSMQKQWESIKALNSNRVLTLDLAMAFVKSNNYENVQVGNQKLAEISNMAGYDQRSFDTLQQIYNYGKSRTFSSIPRVHTQNGEYTYEILRLDDPLAVAIGTLTDCCQELGNAAETSMEHSMVDKNGRVFVIKDEAGNIVAQSWVWRNQNVLCFDNIEIPAKAFIRAERGGSSREHFTDTVFALYQQAGQELIAKDEEEFKKLLDEGKITEEQYEALKLGKVTVGTGYNDIADSLRRNSQPDRSKVARPLDFVPPVNLNHVLYTSDSITQYVIAGEQDVPTSTYETPTIYSDEFVIHDNGNTKQQDVLMLQKLELATRGDSYSGLTQSYETEKIISNIAYNYGLNPETTRIIMNANFAIIYDTTSDEIIVGDVLYNTSFDNNGQQIDISDKVAMQIRMAIEQIGVKGKKFNISRLNQEQLEMCNMAMNLETEIDEERGLSHGAR